MPDRSLHDRFVDACQQHAKRDDLPLTVTAYPVRSNYSIGPVRLTVERTDPVAVRRTWLLFCTNITGDRARWEDANQIQMPGTETIGGRQRLRCRWGGESPVAASPDDTPLWSPHDPLTASVSVYLGWDESTDTYVAADVWPRRYANDSSIEAWTIDLQRARNECRGIELSEHAHNRRFVFPSELALHVFDWQEHLWDTTWQDPVAVTAITAEGEQAVTITVRRSERNKALRPGDTIHVKHRPPDSSMPNPITSRMWRLVDVPPSATPGRLTFLVVPQPEAGRWLSAPYGPTAEERADMWM